MKHVPTAGRAPGPDHCPHDPQETAEAYLLGHLQPDEAHEFEDHYLTCARCAALVEESAGFVAAMRQAAHKLGRSGAEPHMRRGAAARPDGDRGT